MELILAKPFRLESLDIFRGLAIAMMVYTHYFQYTINPVLIHSQLVIAKDLLASYFSVPFFYFIVGYTLVISIREKRRKGYSEGELKKYVLIRALLIYVIGFVLNIYQVGIDHLWHWNTLQIISIGYITTYLLLKRPLTIRLGLIVISIAIAYILAPFYQIYHYGGSWDTTEFILGFVFSGGYPFFPWIAFFLLGSVIAEIKFTRKNIIGVCFLFIPLSLGFVFTMGIIPITKYPASLTYVMLTIIGTVITFYSLFYFYEIKKIGKAQFYPLRIFGMFPLTIFMFHIILGLELIKWFSIGKSLGFVEFLLLYALTVILITGVGILWAKWKFKYSLDWSLKIATDRMLKDQKRDTDSWISRLDFIRE